MTAFQPEQLETLQHIAQDVSATHPELRTRVEKAMTILLFREITFDASRRAWWVESESEPGRLYLTNGTCECADYLRERAPGGACKHRLAVRLLQLSGRALPPPQPETVQPVACEVCGDPALLDAPSAHDGLAHFCASCYDVVREARAEHQHPCHVSGCHYTARTHMELAGHSADMHGWHNYDASAQERAERRVTAA